MFDFSFAELMLAGAAALIILGPERLPHAARTAGRWAGKIQRMAAGVKNELAHHSSYAELAETKRQLENAAIEIRSSISQTSALLQQESTATDAETAAADSASRPAWEQLPAPHTPADFGLDANGRPLPPALGLYTPSLRKQAWARKRDLRPRRRPAPRLRHRK